jgi:hypothetical protein
MSNAGVAEDQHDDDGHRDRLQDARDEIKSLADRVQVLSLSLEQKIELVKIVAKLTRCRHQSLVEAGFSPPEALSLVMNGWTEDME